MGFFLYLKHDSSLTYQLPRIHNLSLLISHDYIGSLTVELASLFPVPDSQRQLSCLLPFLSLKKKVYFLTVFPFTAFFWEGCVVERYRA